MTEDLLQGKIQTEKARDSQLAQTAHWHHGKSLLCTHKRLCH